MVELTQRHLGTDFFTHGDKRDADDSKGLEGIVFRLLLLRLLIAFLLILILLVFAFLLLLRRLLNVLIAVVQQGLNLQDVAGSCERAHIYEDLSLLGYWVLNGLKSRNCCI